MILPFPENFKSFSERPITWSLFGLNLFIYFVFFFGNPEGTAAKKLTEEHFRTAGELYYQYLDHAPTEVLLKQPEWVLRLRRGEPQQMEFLGSYAVRDRLFLNDLAVSSFQGDEVAIASLKTAVTSFLEELTAQPLHRFGLSGDRESSLAWFTYQFSHAGLLHLLSNMVFLILVGSAIEAAFGGTALLLITVLGGVGGGLLFLQLNPHGIIPMVGASGAVSALLAFYALAESRPRVRYYYMILPFPGQHGAIYLPRLLIFPLYLASDFAGVLGSPTGLVSGIAYSAHIGGVVVGALSALVLFRRGKSSAHGVLGHADRLDELS